MPVRGILQNSSGPLTAEDLSLMTGFPERIFELALDELQKQGIQWILANIPTRRENLPEHPDTPGSFGVEGNRTEQNRMELKGTEKGFTRLDVWFEHPAFANAWDGWEEMRKASKSKPTDQARALAFAKLQSLSGGSVENAIQIINESTVSNWKSFYQIKGNQNGPNSHKLEKNSREFKEFLAL
jgi:hypothetical protein